jgi:hypothetical protein
MHYFGLDPIKCSMQDCFVLFFHNKFNFVADTPGSNFSLYSQLTSEQIIQTNYFFYIDFYYNQC